LFCSKTSVLVTSKEALSVGDCFQFVFWFV
jgi:hypothetical protein